MLFERFLFELFVNDIFFGNVNMMMTAGLVGDSFLSQKIDIITRAFFWNSLGWFFDVQVVYFLHSLEKLQTSNWALMILVDWIVLDSILIVSEYILRLWCIC